MRQLSLLLAFLILFEPIALHTIAQAKTGRTNVWARPAAVTATQSHGLDAYRALGLNSDANNISAEQIRTAYRTATFSFEGTAEQFRAYIEGELQNGRGTALLNRFSQSSYLFRKAGGADLTQKVADRLSEIRNNYSTENEARMRAWVEVFEENWSQLRQRSEKMGQLRSQAYNTLNDRVRRAAYDFQNGYRSAKPKVLLNPREAQFSRNGYAVLQTTVDGKPVSILAESGLAELNNITGTDLMKSVKQGVVSTSIASLSFLMIMYASSLKNLATAYHLNPMSLEQLVEEFVTPSYFLSFLSFGLADRAGMAAGNHLIVQNLQVIHRLSERGLIKANPQAMKKVVARAMRGVAVGSTTLGFLTAVVSRHLLDKMAACQKLLTDRPMTLDEREQEQKICDQGFAEFAKEAWPQVALALPMIYSSQFLLAMGGRLTAKAFNGARNIFHGTPKQGGEFINKARTVKTASTSPAAFENMAKTGLSRGLPNQLGRQGLRALLPRMVFLRSVGAISLQFAAFHIIFQTSLMAAKWTLDHYNGGRKIHRAERDFLSAFGAFSSANMSEVRPECLAVDTSELEKNIEENFASVDVDQFYCSDTEAQMGMLGIQTSTELDCRGSWDIEEKLQNYFAAQDEWLTYIERDWLMANQIWKDYFTKALNTYDAANVLYKDVVSQITERRREHDENPFTLRPNDGLGYLVPRDYTERVYERLPLFRSSPFFGVYGEEPFGSWFSRLNLLDTNVWFGIDWSQPDASSEELQSWKDSVEAQRLRIHEAGQWLLEQSRNLTLFKTREDQHLKTRYEEIGRLLSSRYHDEQITGLIQLEQQIQGTWTQNAVCRSHESLAADPICGFYFAQQKMIDIFPHIADFMEDRLLNRAQYCDIFENLVPIAQNVITGLRSPMDQERHAALKTIRETMESEQLRGHCPHGQVSDRFECSFHSAAAMYDKRLFADPFEQDRGGHIRQSFRVPDGPLPLAPGHKYLMDFYQTFDSMGIDHGFHPSTAGHGKNEMYSMTHYLLVSMVCGPDSFNQEGSLMSNRWGFVPAFLPPRLPLLEERDYCRQATSRGNAPNLYHKIDRQDGGHWNGIVDLLYHELDPKVSGTHFDQWWTDHAQKQLIAMLEEEAERIKEPKWNVLKGVFNPESSKDLLRRVYFGKEGGLGNFLSRAASRGEANSIVDQLLSEIDFYFEEFFRPVFEDPRTVWYEDSISHLQADERARLPGYLDDVKWGLTESIRRYANAVIEDPATSEDEYEQVILEIGRLKQLFQGWDPAYFNDFMDGMHPIYPGLSYQNYEASPGESVEENGYLIGSVMRKVIYDRIEQTLIVARMKIGLGMNGDYIEEMIELYGPASN